ncbi:hypothetical protein ACTOWA_04800 [Herbaspirillum seropedicae]|uniref:hypothetical protein n=1 Tax=Herbaspirillum seropedicae TaxID=964 RepID=UPI003F8D1DD4
MSDYHWDWDVNVEASSQFEFEQEGVEFGSVLSMNYYGGSSGVKLTDIDDDEMSVSFSFQATVDFSVDLSFRKWDGIDREYIKMGKTTIETEVDVDIDVNLTIPIRNGELREFEIEIEPEQIHIDLGEVEPDWMSNPDNFG